MREAKKFGSILQITPEMMTSFFALPEGARIIDAQYNMRRDIIEFKVQTDEYMQEYGLPVCEGQEYPNASIYFHLDDDNIEHLKNIYGQRREINAEIQKQRGQESHGND